MVFFPHNHCQIVYLYFSVFQLVTANYFSILIQLEILRKIKNFVTFENFERFGKFKKFKILNFIFEF